MNLLRINAEYTKKRGSARQLQAVFGVRRLQHALVSRRVIPSETQSGAQVAALKFCTAAAAAVDQAYYVPVRQLVKYSNCSEVASSMLTRIDWSLRFAISRSTSSGRTWILASSFPLFFTRYSTESA